MPVRPATFGSHGSTSIIPHWRAIPPRRVQFRDLASRGDAGLAISIRQLRPNFAGEVTGLDCRKPLSSDEVAAIHAGMDRYAVLVFRDQKLSDQEQLRFTL